MITNKVGEYGLARDNRTSSNLIKFIKCLSNLSFVDSTQIGQTVSDIFLHPLFSEIATSILNVLLILLLLIQEGLLHI